MTIPSKISNHNFFAFLWHAGFLALAQNFMDVDTIIPAMIIESGGGAVHIGIMTAIMLGGASFSQLLFAPYVSNHAYKKKFLLLGINSRVLSLFALGVILFFLRTQASGNALLFIFLFISTFSFAGAFTNISYTDILGKSVDETKRKTFFSVKQVIAGSVVLVSAFLAKKVLITFEYPANFAAMFFIGGTLLLIASGGFWKIKETEPSALQINGARTFFRLLRSELTANPKLVYFLGFINTQGIMISFLPFVMLYAKETMNSQSNDTGNFLIFKVVGVVSVSLFVFLASRRIKYNSILYLNAILSLLMIISTLLISSEYPIRYIFIAGGIVFSLYTISMNGVLLEISSREKRAVYTGFAGAGNILPALFPLAGGLAIEKFGFQAFFLLLLVIVSMSLFFIRKTACQK